MVGQVEEPLTVKGINVYTQWELIELGNVDHDFEDGVKNYDGDVELSVDFKMPAAAPSGNYIVKVSGYEETSEAGRNMCVQAEFTI